MPYLPTEDGVTVTPQEAILGNAFSEMRTRAAFRRQILKTPNVIGVLELGMDFDPATRVLRPSWRARTKFGDTPLDSMEMVI